VISHWTLATVARVQSHLSSCGIFGGYSGTWTEFLWSTLVICCWYYSGNAPYLPYFPAHKTHFFFPKNVTLIRPVSYVPRVSIISELINTHMSFIQHLYLTTIFCVSMMNTLYYGCYFWYVTILFSSNKLLKLKYIHHYFFPKISNEKITVRLTGQCVLWAGKYGIPLSLMPCIHKCWQCC